MSDITTPIASELEAVCADLERMHDRSRVRAEQIAIGSIYHRAKALVDKITVVESGVSPVIPL